MNSCTAEELTAADLVEVGRRLGHDIFKFSQWPLWNNWTPCVKEGFAHAQTRGIARHPADRFERKWLQLRLSALSRRLVVSDQVTPAFLREIDVTHCPITREALTHGRQQHTDWSVDRINNDGAYAENNLAVMSTGANTAKGQRGFEHVMALSERPGPTDGLSPVEWLRLAGVMLGPCFSTKVQAAPLIPLLAPIPPRSARPGAQMIQHLWAMQARPASGKNRLIKAFRPLSQNGPGELALHQLAESVHSGLKGLAHATDVWLDNRAMSALNQWRNTLGELRWAAAGRIASQLLSAKVIPSDRLLGWHMGTRGRVQDATVL